MFSAASLIHCLCLLVSAPMVLALSSSMMGLFLLRCPGCIDSGAVWSTFNKPWSTSTDSTVHTVCESAPSHSSATMSVNSGLLENQGSAGSVLFQCESKKSNQAKETEFLTQSSRILRVILV